MDMVMEHPCNPCNPRSKFFAACEQSRLLSAKIAKQASYEWGFGFRPADFTLCTQSALSDLQSQRDCVLQPSPRVTSRERRFLSRGPCNRRDAKSRPERRPGVAASEFYQLEPAIPKPAGRESFLGPGEVSGQVGKVRRVPRQEFIGLALVSYPRVPIVINAGALDTKPFGFVQTGEGFLRG